MTAKLQRLRAETDRYVAIDAKALDCDPEEDALAHALAAERAHADAERESLLEALRVKHKALERLTYLYESEQDTEALERVGRPDWLRVALSRLRLSIPEWAADREEPCRRCDGSGYEVDLYPDGSADREPCGTCNEKASQP